MSFIIGKSSRVKAEEYCCFNAGVFLLPFCVVPLLLVPGLSPDWQSLWARWRRESLLAGRKWVSDRAVFTTSRHYIGFMHERGWIWSDIERLHVMSQEVWLPLILMLQSCKFFKGNLGSPSNPNLQYGHFETYHWFYKNVQSLVLMYGVLWRMARNCHAP